MGMVANGQSRTHKNWMVYIVGKEYLRLKWDTPKYKGVDPEGKEHYFYFLKLFCDEHKLSVDGVTAHMHGRYKHYKKWIFIRLYEL